MDCYIITLDKNYKNTNKYKSLLNIGLKPIIMPGIRAIKKDLDMYPFRPKIAVGIFLAHKNVWKRIVTDNSQMALILEDDVTPKQKIDFNELTKQEFDILKLHTDNNDSSKSAAAYIISNKTAKIFTDSFNVIFGHVDMDIWVNCKLKGLKLKVNKNLFETDESNSTNRINLKRSLYSYINDDVFKNKTAEKTNNESLSYKAFRVFNHEITTRESYVLLATAILLLLGRFIIKNKTVYFTICIIYILYVVIYGLEIF